MVAVLLTRSVAAKVHVELPSGTLIGAVLVCVASGHQRLPLWAFQLSAAVGQVVVSAVGSLLRLVLTLERPTPLSLAVIVTLVGLVAVHVSLAGRPLTARSTGALEFPRFDGHLTAGPSGLAWRMSVDAQDPAVFAGVPS